MNVTKELAALQDRLDEMDTDHMEVIFGSFMLVSACFILLMQPGFAFLEAGQVRSKNVKSVLYKNIFDFGVGAIIWWLFGYGLSENIYFLGPPLNHEIFYFFHTFTFAATASTIVSGAVAERIRFSAYILLSVFVTGIIYPCLVLWVWTEGGWLGQLGFIDHAGSGVVHMCGGTCALVCCKLVGPRKERFIVDDEEGENASEKELLSTGKVVVRPLPGHSPTDSYLGAFFLIIGWLFFNASSGFTDAHKLNMEAVAVAMINTFMAMASAATVRLVYKQCQHGTHDITDSVNAWLGGAVAITASCSFVDGWAALLIGAGAAVLTPMASDFLQRMRVDDVVDASPVHLVNGIYGVLCVGLFSHPNDDIDCCVVQPKSYGVVLYPLLPGPWKQLGIQLAGCIFIIAWSGGVTALVLGLLMLLSPKKNPLRVDVNDELLGLDMKYHEGLPPRSQSSFPDLQF